MVFGYIVEAARGLRGALVRDSETARMVMMSQCFSRKLSTMDLRKRTQDCCDGLQYQDLPQVPPLEQLSW